METSEINSVNQFIYWNSIVFVLNTCMSIKQEKRRYLQLVPEVIDISPLQPIVSDHEMTKEEIIVKASGTVQRPLLNIIKLMKFRKMGIDGGGKLYIV